MFSRILLTTDFSAQAEQAYPWAARLATSNQGVIQLVHALEDDLVATAPVFADYMAPSALDLGNYRQEFRIGAKKALEAAAEILRGMGAEVETHLVEHGRPSHAVVAAADEFACTVIVISTHGRGGLAHMLLGSTAEKVVRLAKVPVLTVHEGDVPPSEPGS